MDQLNKLLDQLESQIKNKNTNNQTIIEALKSETENLYIFYCLEMCQQKLTNTLEKSTIDKIKALKNNFDICEEHKNFVVDSALEKEFLDNLYSK